ncbi:response regulator receiver protein [Methanolacinia petrolearia DSM 11571]|uniref:Response regulator receiver protein n=1 Tax=Methanolacinia petrolearia (strain DSM 11571 / OCM 486 / SEBR 4847) TaxID=679926 RepID=E1RHV4_METP4|nr:MULTISPECIES: response regulator [Methanolacinia]ADN36492.1 response regulator receiver protein [Methanolacinia petrolearia DSM 11571]
MYDILVVDDSPMIVDVFVAMLERGGYRPTAAYSGPECLEILKDMKPDLILLDIMMEPMDGWETLENIKTNPDTRDIPVMMLTAKQLTPEEAQEYGAYIEDYVMKPTTHRQLYEAIEYILKRKDEISQKIEEAKEAGIEDRIIEEYERLSKSVDVSRRLLKILESTYNISNDELKVGENIAQAIKSMEMSINLQEERLKQIKKTFIP